ncbi:MAG: hypothetical protein AB8I08_04775 [Sandaracinaceae bacterium]
MRLHDALAALDHRAFERLCRRRGVVIDDRKRMTPAQQAARQLAERARRVPLEALPPPAREAAHRLAHLPEGEPRASLGGGGMVLIDEDLVFAHPERREHCAMPSAFRVSLPPWRTEDRRGVRAMLSASDEAVWAVLGKHALGRQPVGPPPLYLEPVLEALETGRGLDRLLGALSPKQRRLIDAVEARGGQLETDELLALERFAVRIRLASGALPPRSASHHLFVRGLILPRANGIWALPTEVAERVGEPRRRVEREAKKRLLAEVAENVDLEPARAELAEDPSAAAVALLAALASAGELAPAGAPVRRSAVKRAARDVGVDPSRAELLVCLARAAGAPLREGTVGEVGARLFRSWRAGAAWDEARLDADAHRLDPRRRMPTPTRGLRDAVIELLEAMPESRFAPVAELCRTAVGDLRNTTAPRLLSAARVKDKNGCAADAMAIVLRILNETLPRIGAVDRGRVDGREVVRLSRGARRWAAGGPSASRATEAHWEGGGRLRVGSRTAVGTVIAAAVGTTPLVVDGLLLRVDPESAERGLLKEEAEEIERRWTELAGPLDPMAERALRQADGRARLTLVPASAFLPVDDPELRARLLDSPPMRELVLANGPPDGLLIRVGVSRTQLVRALASVGVRLDALKEG